MAEDIEGAVFALARGARLLENCLVDVTLPQVRVLRLVAVAPERASAIAEKAVVSRPSLTGVLDGLEKRGWIRRAAVAGDRRGVSLEVTAEGLAALREAEKPMIGRLDEVLSTLSESERSSALDGLAMLATGLERWSTDRATRRSG